MTEERKKRGPGKLRHTKEDCRSLTWLRSTFGWWEMCSHVHNMQPASYPISFIVFNRFHASKNVFRWLNLDALFFTLFAEPVDLSGWILIYHSPNYLFHLTVFLFLFTVTHESLWRRQLSNNASTLWLFNLNFLLQCCVCCQFSVKNLFAPATLGRRVKKWNFQFLSRCWLFICCAIWLLGHKKKCRDSTRIDRTDSNMWEKLDNRHNTRP